jgi:hypothetical protein
MIPRADSNSPFARCKQETELKLIAPFGVMCVLLARCLVVARPTHRRGALYPLPTSVG